MIYVHVPFCCSFCTYCDFYSEIVGCRPEQQGESRGLRAGEEPGEGRGFRAREEPGRNRGFRAGEEPRESQPLRAGEEPGTGRGLVAFSGENATDPGFLAGVSRKKDRFCNQPLREAALFERYTDDLCAEIRARREEILATSGVRTLYIGGGTPSVLPLESLRRIVDCLQEAVGQSSMRKFFASGPGVAVAEQTAAARRTGIEHLWEEFTVEVNPEDIVERGPEYVRGLLELGVNRISMGVQSLDDGMLRWMNRRHSADGARKAWRILTLVRANQQKVPIMTVPPSEIVGVPSKSAKNDSPLNDRKGSPSERGPSGMISYRESELSLSIDLISGVPGMDCEMLERTVDEVLQWRPEHISAYQLSVEEGSALARMIEDGRAAELPDEECRAQYELLCRKLSAAGYHHYEISNWALPGHEAVHNSAYWTRQPYVGLGPGAHSLEKLPRQKGPETSDPPAKIEGGPSKTAENAGAAEEDKGSDGRVPREIRKWNSRRPTGWGEEGREVLTEEEIHEETVMLLARTDRGPIPERDWFVADELIPDLL